ncbi:hypothetical protein ACO0LC_18590 [Undibacterium sp. JH2W]
MFSSRKPGREPEDECEFFRAGMAANAMLKVALPMQMPDVHKA